MAEQRGKDRELVTVVKEALLRETESAGIDVQVSATEGGVRLSGVVDVLSHRRAAGEIAHRLLGRGRVENDITVANEEGVSDKALQERVTEALARHDRFRRLGAHVHRGVVTLMGRADRVETVDEAFRMAEGLAGVREVRVEDVHLGAGTEADEAAASAAALHLLEQMGYDPVAFQIYCWEGRLFVKGILPAGADPRQIEGALRRLPGVERVESTLVTADQIEEIH